MGKFVLKGVRLFVGGADLTGNTNKVELSSEVEVKDATAFNPASPTEVWQEVLAGLASTKASGAGQWEAADPSRVDDASWAGLGGVGAWTACPAGAAVGDVAWLTRMMQGSYQLGGAVGEVAPWSADWSGSWPLSRGQVLHPPGTARTATGTGTARQLGALLDTGALYVTLHVLSAAGITPSITVVVESDDTVGFGSPTTRATFTAATARGGQAVKVAGPVTDDWWRVRWTISGTTPSFLFVAAAGIGPA
ncbi:hypothetical protein [Micromonospora humidisoli]|uniref:Phage tail protein n=1 Tax=Micromonospora humidisoli TaxID=2807622 RepID=A0ABS2JB68_9ACTN|nr:hypothetical protein [Micromonospora humidisoli]MBM7083604.1 hypothetical protein [Micromonospora humidisoli]